MAELKAIN